MDFLDTVIVLIALTVFLSLFAAALLRGRWHAPSAAADLAVHRAASFDELLRDVESAGLDSTALATARGMSDSALAVALDELAIEVARRFNAGRLDFARGDAVMNSAWSYHLYWCTDESRGLPEVLDAIYDAFDAGEDSRVPDEDPVERFTKPMISQVLMRLDAARPTKAST